MVHPPRSGVFTPKIRIDYSTIYSIYPQKTASTASTFTSPKNYLNTGFYQGFLEEIIRDIWNSPHSSIIQPPPVRTWGSWRRVVADGHWEMFDLRFPIVFSRSMILEVGKFRRIWQISRILSLLVLNIVYLLGHPESNPRTLEHLHSQTWVGLTLMFFLFSIPGKNRCMAKHTHIPYCVFR